MNEYNYLLDHITLTDDRELIGIIDFYNNKQLYFFNFSQEETTDYHILSMLWKGNNPSIRFSVYILLYHSEIKLPEANLIQLSNIKSINNNLIEYKKPKQRKRSLRTN